MNDRPRSGTVLPSATAAASPSAQRMADAVVRVARRVGLGSIRTNVLSMGFGGMVAVTDRPVVARVCQRTLDRARGASSAAQLELAAYAASRGAPIAGPAAACPPGPHEAGDLLVTFWDKVSDQRPTTPEAVGIALRQLHDALATSAVAPRHDRPQHDRPERDPQHDLPEQDPQHVLQEQDPRRFNLPEQDPQHDLPERDPRRFNLPSFDPRPTVRRVVAALPPGSDAVEALLLAAAEALDLPELPVQPLHGDAHLGNALGGRSGPLWIDLEDACYGPVEWDLATAAHRATVFGETVEETHALLRAYGSDAVERSRLLTPACALESAAWTAYAAATRPQLAAARDLRIDWVRKNVL